MTQKATLIFEGVAVLELLTHAKASPKHTSPYGLRSNPGPGLMLVKDDGIYLMSNGKPGLPGADTANTVVYARGYEALPATVSMEARMIRYDKIRNAVGGDDFAEFLPAKDFVRLVPGGQVAIELSTEQMIISIVGPPTEPLPAKSR